MVKRDALALAGESFPTFRLPDVPPVTPEVQPTPPEHAAESEWLARIDRAFRQLDEFHQRILTLRSSRNLSYDEIAGELRVGRDAVKAAIVTARETLRTFLMQDSPDLGRARVTSPS